MDSGLSINVKSLQSSVVSDDAWNRFKVASYEPTVSVRPDHVKKLRRGRKYGRGRGRVKREERSGESEDDIYEDEDFEDTDDGKIIKERSAVYPKHHGGKER